MLDPWVGKTEIRAEARSQSCFRIQSQNQGWQDCYQEHVSNRAPVEADLTPDWQLEWGWSWFTGMLQGSAIGSMASRPDTVARMTVAPPGALVDVTGCRTAAKWGWNQVHKEMGLFLFCTQDHIWLACHQG